MVSNNRDKKMIIFVETCSEVDYLALLLSKMTHFNNNDAENYENGREQRPDKGLKKEKREK